MGPKLARKFYLKEFKSISHAISTYDDLNLLIMHLAERTAKTFMSKGCSIMLYDENENQLFSVASYGISDGYLTKGPVFVNDSYSAFTKGVPVFVEDMQTDPRVQYPEEAKREGIVSMLSVPIKFRESVIGLMRIYQDKKWEINEEDVDSICVLTTQLGSVIEYNGLKNFFEKVKISLESLPKRLMQGI
jgi:signal transduction protein with GAF and PtsI domain